MCAGEKRSHLAPPVRVSIIPMQTRLSLLSRASLTVTVISLCSLFLTNAVPVFFSSVYSHWFASCRSFYLLSLHLSSSVSVSALNIISTLVLFGHNMMTMSCTCVCVPSVFVCVCMRVSHSRTRCFFSNTACPDLY